MLVLTTLFTNVLTYLPPTPIYLPTNLFTYLIIFNLFLTYLSIHLLTYMPTSYFILTKKHLPNYFLPLIAYLPLPMDYKLPTYLPPILNLPIN
jgi:hypothetical protein